MSFEEPGDPAAFDDHEMRLTQQEDSSAFSRLCDRVCSGLVWLVFVPLSVLLVMALLAWAFLR